MRYLAIFSILGKIDYQEHQTLEDAILHLQQGADNSFLFEIAIYDLLENEIVWRQPHKLTEQEIKDDVNEALKKYKTVV